jgi:hypothetical protein
MSYECLVLADSINNWGDRLTTFSVTFPRFILAEVNTHCALSRNSASSRAIPTERIIQEVRENPFVPMTFNARVKGMGVGTALDDRAQDHARAEWLTARDAAVAAADQLTRLNVDKSRANRLLEPFMWHTAVISATDWDNFFALRCPEGDEPTIDFPAQLEFQQIAIMMRNALRDHEPQHLTWGQWHLPLITDEDWFGATIANDTDDDTLEAIKRVSAGRLARWSSYNRRDPEPLKTSYERGVRLIADGHMSPTEHIGTPMKEEMRFRHPRSGKFTGFIQWRKQIPHEANYGEIRYAQSY